MTQDWPAGWGRVVLPSVDSTMAEAARRAKEASGPLWILTHEQTAGRGRRGRPWISAPGNFAASLVLPLSEDSGRVALRSFVAALALGDALGAVTGRAANLAFKWPNDVLLNGGKVAGILLERLGQTGPLVIGVGVNLASAPTPAELEPGAVRPVDLVSQTGVRVTPEEFLSPLAAAFARWEARFRQEGFAPVRAAWLGRAARLGERIRARTGSVERSGIFETVDLNGNLVLKTAEGRLALPAADVFF